MTQVLNFASFKVQKSANERSSQTGVLRGQNFKLKFRKFKSGKDNKESIETIFTVSDEKFAELGLAEYGIVQLEGTAYVAVVDNDNATMVKRTDKLKDGAPKGKKFKSTILEKVLLDSGVITDEIGKTQFLDLVKVSDATTLEGGLAVQAIYEIVKGEDKRSDDEKKSEDSGSEGDAPETDEQHLEREIAEEQRAGSANSSTTGATETVEDDF